MFCQNCGKEIENNLKFCPECGSEQNANSSKVGESNNNIISNYQQFNQQQDGPNRGYATISMVLGILSIVICCLCPLFGVPAMICGIISLNKKEPETGKAWFGIIVGIISLILAFIGLKNQI